MAQSFGDNGQFGKNKSDGIVRSIPIIGTVSWDGIPTIIGIAEPQRKNEQGEEEKQRTMDQSQPIMESTFIVDEEEEIPDIDVEIAEEVMLTKLYKGAPNAEIETIEEEEEPSEEEESGREGHREEQWKRREEKEREPMEEGESGRERDKEQRWKRREEKEREPMEEEESGREGHREERWKRREEKEREPMEEGESGRERDKEQRWKRLGLEAEQREQREGGSVEEGEGHAGKEIAVGIELMKEKEEAAEVVLGYAESTTQKQKQQIVLVVPERETKQMPTEPMAMPTEPMAMPIEPMVRPLPEENASKTVSIVNEVQASTSTVETTIWQRTMAGEQTKAIPGLKQLKNGSADGGRGVGAVHVRQRMADDDGTFEEQTPFLELRTTQTVWREDEEGGGGAQTTEGTARPKMNGAEERRKLAEGEAILRQLMQENNSPTEQKTEQCQHQPQQMSRNVTIEMCDWKPEQKREERSVQMVHVVRVEQQQPQKAFRHDALYATPKNGPTANNRMEKHQTQLAHHRLASTTASTHNHWHNQIPAERQNHSPSPQHQNGPLIARSPGPHSPFGLEPPAEDEEWRLSPKTLSRIKRLNVVMETDGRDSADVIHHHPVFVKDTSRYWYKPTISREDAIAMLKNKPPGTFIVRDSNSFPGAFGLALKVAQPPAGVHSSVDGNELVRHFLIEPSPKGVRLKGCSNEPVFGTLAALVYQHSITPLALPCRLILPEFDPAATPEHLNSNQALLERGAACNVTYLCSVDTESLTGPEALRRSTAHCFELLQRRELKAVSVHFKVSSQGITLTDNTRSMFFRRHYPVNKVTFAGIDPESRVFDNNNVSQLPPTYVRQAPIFGFVARKCAVSDHSGSVENACHLFAELDPDQPASAVVRFITNVMMPIGRSQLHQIHQNVNAQ